MKDNMVQELLLRAILSEQKPRQPIANISQVQKTLTDSMPNEQRASLNTLLKSLYLNNARNNGSSNINNVNISKTEQMPQATQQSAFGPQGFEEFLKEDPEFFNGREILFDYLSSNGRFDKEELKKIAQIAKMLEDSAIKRFCAKNPKYAQFLQQENQKTLNKLETAANNGYEGTIKGTPVFSAEDISKMSNDEFLKNESAINSQINELLKNVR